MEKRNDNDPSSSGFKLDQIKQNIIEKVEVQTKRMLQHVRDKRTKVANFGFKNKEVQVFPFSFFLLIYLKT